MRKRDELTNPNSCMSRARDDEITFVLLEREESPDTIRFWISKRIELGKNQPGDAQLVDAENLAREMEIEMARRNSR
jgi:hypothetical protein